jgi:hypothetical protein
LKARSVIQKAALGLVLAGSLQACASHAYVTAAVWYPAPPPPPPRAEVVVASPGAVYAFVPGHWAWRAHRGQYVWISGLWTRPPRPGAVWIEPSYERRDGRWVWLSGYWRY